MTFLGMVAIFGAIWRIWTILGRVTFLGMVTILIISDHHRGGDHPRDSGCVRDFYLIVLHFGSIES